MHTISIDNLPLFKIFGWQPLRKKTKVVESPDSWETMNKRQLKKLGLVYEFKKMTPSNEFWLLYHWSKVPKRVLMEITELDVFNLIDFVYKDCSMFHSKYNWHRILRGPQNFLKNFTMDQFGLSQLVFKQFIETGDMAVLDTLAAVCYQPFFFRFNPKLVGILRFYFKYCVRRYKKMAMAINYVALRNEVMSAHPHVFPKSEEDTVEDNPFQVETVQYDWEHTTMLMAGERFGSVDVVRKTKVIPVLKYAEMMAIENAKKKKK